MDSESVDALARWIRDHAPVFLLTGAGVSTASGVGDYRNRDGEWKRKPPVTIQDFLATPLGRKRYWARSLLGFPQFMAARPNAAHAAIAELERAGLFTLTVTQNVDRLHQRAGSREVVDLHGRIDAVVCLDCGERDDRFALQTRLEAANPSFVELRADLAPDGDADLDGIEFDAFELPRCRACDGAMLKPDVVFFGENVARRDLQRSLDALATAGGALFAGSSLMVFSGFRFARRASEQGQSVALLNHGRTRADDLAALKIEAPVERLLPRVVAALGVRPGP